MIALHTIALEPMRWRPEKVLCPLLELLPAIAAAGFGPLEVFEPHLTRASDENVLVGAFQEHGLTPVVLSSYLDLSPASNPDPAFLAGSEDLLARIDRFDFRKVRLFPGRSPSPDQDDDTLRAVSKRLGHLAGQRPDVQFIIETHDNSLADNPQNMVRLLESAGRENTGLVWQPLRFEQASARSQFEIQRPYVRHFHLQNRRSGAQGEFVRLNEGAIDWREFLLAAGPGVDATLEFVPSGICPPEAFDLAATIAQARAETDWVKGLTGKP